MIGQINRNTVTGEFIYNLCLLESNKTIVEIGTWNGAGSTKCIIDALLTRFDEYKFYSLEVNKKMYDLAKTYWDQALLSCNSLIKEQINILHGTVINKDEMIPLEEIRNYNNYIKDWEKWYSDDIASFESCQNILNLIPEKIDVLLLDGGEFSTLAEFNKLKSRTKYILCDDTNTTKCSKITEIMNNDDKNYKLIFDNQTDGRNGFMAFERIK